MKKLLPMLLLAITFVVVAAAPSFAQGAPYPTQPPNKTVRPIIVLDSNSYLAAPLAASTRVGDTTPVATQTASEPVIVTADGAPYPTVPPKMVSEPVVLIADGAPYPTVPPSKT
ncbi:MAG: hypothetical protein JO187_13250 [Acidobacteria bacterium]|nr:hypothetical protein [Acidobacteriota bacterium]